MQVQKFIPTYTADGATAVKESTLELNTKHIKLTLLLDLTVN